jgi:hypothetical protein
MGNYSLGSRQHGQPPSIEYNRKVAVRLSSQLWD